MTGSGAGQIMAQGLKVAIAAWLWISSFPTGTSVRGDDRGDTQAPPAARYVTLTSPIDDQQIGWVREIGLELQKEAGQEDRRAILVLEITPGTSQFHHVYGLADFLTSSALSRVTTVAWVPKTVTGNNVLAGLACKEIVLHPDAQLGDIGRGEAIPSDQQEIVLNLAAKRHNPRVNRALAEALMDPQATLLQLTVEPAEGVSEHRLVTEAEASRLRDSGVLIRDSATVKERGVPGLISGIQARNSDILAARVVENRNELAAAYGMRLESLRERAAPGTYENVALIDVQGTIDPLLDSFLKRQIDRAVSDGARLIIFEIQSPGGLLWHSRDLAYTIADLEEREVRTVAFIHGEALSGATIIALGCDEIYMTKHATIGDAGPIEAGEGGQFERAPEKVLSFLRETMETLADRKGRPSALVMAMADKDLVVYEVTNKNTGDIWFMSEDQIHASNEEWVRGRMIPESAEGNLLTVNGTRAHELKLAERPVADLEELKERLGVPPDVTPKKVARTWIDDTVFLLNTNVVTGLLFFLGIVFIYLELHFMSGLLGILSALCFGIFFWSKFLGGTAGWLEVMLFALGLGCLALEIFVIPGFGVFGVTGALLVFAALIMASQTFGNLEPNQDFSEATRTMATLSTSIIAVIVMAMALSRFLPRIPILNQMILTPPGMASVRSPDEPQLHPDLTTDHAGEFVGRMGTALTVLRPAGKARIGDHLVDVVSDGPFIKQGASVEVMEVSGNRIVVREA